MTEFYNSLNEWWRINHYRFPKDAIGYGPRENDDPVQDLIDIFRAAGWSPPLPQPDTTLDQIAVAEEGKMVYGPAWKDDWQSQARAAGWSPPDSILHTVLRLLQADPHQWSKRPCETCRIITEVTRIDFGCVKYSKEPK